MPNWWDEDLVSNKPSASSSVGKTKEKNWWEDDVVGAKPAQSNKKGEALVKDDPEWYNSNFWKNATFRGNKDTIDKAGSGFGQSAVKGVPILGKLAPENKYQDKYEEENPMMSALGNVVGGVASTIPLAGGVAARSGTGLLSQMGNQGMLGTTLAGADKLAEKGSNVQDDEMLKALGLGAASGAAGPIIARGISPASYVKPTVPGPKGPDPSLTEFDKLMLKVRPNARTVQPPAESESMQMLKKVSEDMARKKQIIEQSKSSMPPWLDKTLDHVSKSALPGMMGGLTGHMVGGPLGGMVGAGLGAAAPHTKEIMSKIVLPIIGNSKMQQPGPMAILNALMMTGADQALDQ